jgi:heat shock protein HslJ
MPKAAAIYGRRRSRILEVVAVVALAVVLVSCTSQAPSPPALPSQGPGSDSPEITPERGTPEPSDSDTWVLIDASFRGQPLPLLAERPITLVLGASKLSGASTCNQYWADVLISDGSVHLTNIVATAMDCGADVNDSDMAFLDALPATTRIDDSRPDMLVLTGPELELRFSPASDTSSD